MQALCDNLLETANFYELISCAERVLGPYDNKTNGRKVVIIIDDNGKRRTMSYPKYLMIKHLGLSIEEADNKDITVDHINRNKEDNDINNLRVVPRAEHSKLDTRRVKLIDLICDTCGKEFQRSPRLLRDKNKKGNTGVFCSRRCSGIYSRKRQLNQIDKLDVQPYIESEYYRHSKSIAEVSEYLINKYGIQF